MTKCKLNAWRNIQLTTLFFVIAPQVTAPTWQPQISLTSYQRRWRQRSSWLLRSPWEQKCLRRTSGTSCICVTRCVCVCVCVTDPYRIPPYPTEEKEGNSDDIT